MGERFNKILGKVFGEAKDTMPKPSYTTVKRVETASYNKESKRWSFTVADDVPSGATSGFTRGVTKDERYTDVYRFETAPSGDFYASRSDMVSHSGTGSNAFRELQREIREDPVVHYERDVYHPANPRQYDNDPRMDTRNLQGLDPRTPQRWRGIDPDPRNDMTLDRRLYNNEREAQIEYERASRYDVSLDYQPGIGGNYDMPAERPEPERWPGDPDY